MSWWQKLFGIVATEVAEDWTTTASSAIQNGIRELETALHAVRVKLQNSGTNYDNEVYARFAQAERVWNNLHSVASRDKHTISRATHRKLMQLENEYKSYRTQIGYPVFDD